MTRGIYNTSPVGPGSGGGGGGFSYGRTMFGKSSLGTGTTAGFFFPYEFSFSASENHSTRIGEQFPIEIIGGRIYHDAESTSPAWSVGSLNYEFRKTTTSSDVVVGNKAVVPADTLVNKFTTRPGGSGGIASFIDFVPADFSDLIFTSTEFLTVSIFLTNVNWTTPDIFLQVNWKTALIS